MKRHLTPDGALTYTIELRPTVNIHEPNELVVVMSTKVKDELGESYEMKNVLSADDFKLFVRDVMTDLLVAQKDHGIATKAETPGPPPLWKPGDTNLN